MAELKMTGNCLRGSRPLLSFDKSFDASGENPKPHFVLLKELFTQIFSVPNRHPKSQPSLTGFTHSVQPKMGKYGFDIIKSLPKMAPLQKSVLDTF